MGRNQTLPSTCSIASWLVHSHNDVDKSGCTYLLISVLCSVVTSLAEIYKISDIIILSQKLVTKSYVLLTKKDKLSYSSYRFTI